MQERGCKQHCAEYEDGKQVKADECRWFSLQGESEVRTTKAWSSPRHLGREGTLILRPTYTNTTPRLYLVVKQVIDNLFERRL